MGWLNFFRSKKETEKKVKKITLSEADMLLEQELNKEENNMKEIKKRVNEKINGFISNLKDQIKTLNLIDLKEKKEYEKIKLITLRGLEEYINQLNRLINNLEKINKEIKASSYFKEINVSMDVFFRSSHKTLEKATILIGKELVPVKGIIKIFYKEINIIAQENIRSASKIDDIKKLQNLKKSFFKIKKTQDEINNIISILEEEKKKIMNERAEKEKELCLFKECKEFKKWGEKKEKIKNEIEILNREAIKIKEKMDLKSLLKQFHEIEKMRELIKDYRNNFLNALESDKELEIIQMLGLDKRESIGKEVKKIREKSLNLKKEKELHNVNKELDSLSATLKKIDYKIVEIVEKIEEENKKLKRFDGKQNILQEEIIEKIENILNGVKIVE